MKPDAPQPPSSERRPYEPPAVIYEGKLSTRAGTPTGPGTDTLPGVDPADIFGSNQ